MRGTNQVALIYKYLSVKNRNWKLGMTFFYTYTVHVCIIIVFTIVMQLPVQGPVLLSYSPIAYNERERNLILRKHLSFANDLHNSLPLQNEAIIWTVILCLRKIKEAILYSINFCCAWLWRINKPIKWNLLLKLLWFII